MDLSRGPGKTYPVKTSLEKRLVITVAILVTIGIGLAISIIHLKQSNNETIRNLKGQFSAKNAVLRNWEGPLNERNVCLTTPCITEAANLLKSMDTSADPCTDFYSFVCGNWIKNKYLASSKESQFTNLEKTIILRVKEILEVSGKDKSLPWNMQKTVDFYKACMDEDHRDELASQELVSDLKKFGGWPLIEKDWKAYNFDWVDLMLRLSKNGYISNMLFKVNVDVDMKNISRSLLKVSQPTLGLIQKLYYILPEEDIIKSYKDAILELAKLFGENIDGKKSMRDIEEAFKVENKIAHIMEHQDMEYNIFTLEELEYFASKIPWRKIFTNLLPPGIFITDDERIMVTSATYIQRLDILLREMDSEIGRKKLANYMFYRVVINAISQEYHGLVNELSKTDNVGSYLPWEVCAKTALVLFPLPLTASYVRRYTDNKTNNVIRIMVEYIKNSLSDHIRSADWLDTDTKSHALWKVKNMKVVIGYQDEIMNDGNLDRYYKSANITDNHFGNIKEMIAFYARQSMKGLHEKRDRLGWFEENNLLTANAYYRRIGNSITIPVGVLHDEFYAAGRPNYINYGSLGMIVGHELTHAFDNSGSLYDAEGNYRTWWSEESFEHFKKKMRCYEMQYDNYYVTRANVYINGAHTLGENIADNGGLKAAYYAYNRLLTRIGSEKSLTGLQYNEKQMFWIAFASVWCKKQTDESVKKDMVYNTHTLSKFRVIGSLSNIKEFSEDFNCKLNSTMNPASKCSLWQ